MGRPPGPAARRRTEHPASGGSPALPAVPGRGRRGQRAVAFPPADEGRGSGPNVEVGPGSESPATGGPGLGSQAAAGVPLGFEPPLDGRGGLQVHNRYLITENEDGVVIIDQHALHERILYEQLREKVLAGALERQRLLVPEPVSLTPAEAAAALDARDALAGLGIEIEPFGGGTVLVSSYPAMLANLNPGDMLRQLITHLLTQPRPPERRDLLDDLLHLISVQSRDQGRRSAFDRRGRGLAAAAASVSGHPSLSPRTPDGPGVHEGRVGQTVQTHVRCPMICVSIGRGRHKHLLAEHRHLADDGIRLVELRVDYVRSQVNLRRLLTDRPCPCIITCRREQDGGQWNDTEQARLTVLRTAIAEGADYVDLEEDIAGAVPRFGKTKRIVSYHNFRETPADLEEIHRRLAAKDADIVKIATMAQRPTDNVRMLRLMRAVKVPTVGICMGEIGIPTRLLANKFGAPFTYATFHLERKMAPGQIGYRQMREIFRFDELNADTEVFGVVADPAAQHLGPDRAQRRVPGTENESRVCPLSRAARRTAVVHGGLPGTGHQRDRRRRFRTRKTLCGSWPRATGPCAGSGRRRRCCSNRTPWWATTPTTGPSPTAWTSSSRRASRAAAWSAGRPWCWGPAASPGPLSSG